MKEIEKLSSDIWKRLEDSVTLNVRQGEETLTDNLLLDLAKFKLKNIRTLPTTKKNEKQIGCDWEWWIGSNKFGWFRFAIQAKKLDHPRPVYKKLAHKVITDPIKKTKERQFDILERYCKKNNVIGLYCFYNYTTIGKLDSYWNCTFPFDQEQLGWTFTTLDVVKKALGSRKGKSFESIHSNKDSLPMRCLFKCPKVLNNYFLNNASPLSIFGQEAIKYNELPPIFRDFNNADGYENYPEDIYDKELGLYPKKILIIDIGEEITAANNS